jgi:hypothetical protein
MEKPKTVHKLTALALGVFLMSVAVGWAALSADQQLSGMSSRGVAPEPRSKPSGRPFLAHFVDVAAEVGLTAPIVFGGEDQNDYILKVKGCGVAFLDDDNDGWLDVLLLTGSRMEGAPSGATNRLYRNNHDGTFIDVTDKSELRRSG